MKKLFLVLLPVLSLTISACSGSKSVRTDSVEIADSVNQTRSGEPGYNKASAGFLVDAADARMMGMKEGREAVKKGTSPEIRNYGRLMVKDQTALLSQIRKLAAAEKITLPTQISNSKKEGFSQLAELSGEDFDRRFIKMMIIDHERDVKEFKDAQSTSNKAIASFATAKLPVIQTHLDKINAIRDQQKN